MSTQEEILVYPDGSTSSSQPQGQAYEEEEEDLLLFHNTTFSSSFSSDEFLNLTNHSSSSSSFSSSEEEWTNTLPSHRAVDPAIYLIFGFLLVMAFFYFFYKRSQKKREEQEAFFRELDGDKFNIKLPTAVEEYYQVKAKCEEAGWEAGKPPATAQEAANGPTRILAQALMKRCIADIPLVTHLQKESAGMNKLYSQSMCSVKQWKSYQAAEALISMEVEEVRAEADEIEPGWSQLIWKQAMQYHNMLKSRHEMEAKAAAASREQQLQIQQQQQQMQLQQQMQQQQMQQQQSQATLPSKKKDDTENPSKLSEEEIRRLKEEAAEKAAQELLKMEEREKESKKSFSSGSGMKKGFLDSSHKQGSKKK